MARRPSEHLSPIAEFLSRRLSATIALWLLLLPVWTLDAQASGSTPSGQVLTAADKYFYFYHGARSTSGFVVPADNGGYRFVGERVLRSTLPAGARVCVAVVNGHAINYAYGLDSSIDSSAALLPDVSQQSLLLARVFPPGPPTSRDQGKGRDSTAPPPPAWASALSVYASRVRDSLEADLVIARRLVALSDTPEALAAVSRERAPSGFRMARDSLNGLPKGPGHVNDPRLAETLASWSKAAESAAAADSIGQFAVSALAAYAAALRGERDQLVGAFNRAEEMPEVCVRVSKGRTTFSLAIAPKDSSAKLKRAMTKDLAFRIINDAPYDRSPVTLAPIALAVSAPGSPEFTIDNGILRDTGTQVHFRVGVVLAINSNSSGPFGLIGKSFGLGIASGGNDSPVSDIFANAMVGFGDLMGTRGELIRIGVGVGATYAPTRVKGFLVNQPYPDSAGDLADRLDRHWKPAFYLTFVIPGLAVGGGA